MATRSELSGGILVVTLDNPPVNSLGHELRQSLLAALQGAEEQPRIRAVVVIGANGVFCGGADLRVLGTPHYWAYPRTIELAAAIDGMTKPVVAAVGGLAMGGGMELAMGCHWRVVTPDARLALPEVRLGLLPGGGGTIRLPRLVGVETATHMMLSGESVDGSRAREIGLADAVAEGDLLEAALHFTRALLERGEGPRRARDLPVQGSAEWFHAKRAALDAQGAQGPAARTILDCIEAGVLLPMEDAAKVADAGTRALIESRESQALRYLFFAERQAGKMAEVAHAGRRPIDRVAVCGGETGDMTALFSHGGVVLSDVDPALVIATRIDEQTLRDMDARAAPHVPFATTGTFADWQRLQALLPHRTVLGLRFTGARAVELVRPPGADAAALDAVARLLRRLDKVCIACAPSPGFIVERLQAISERYPAGTEQRYAAMAAEGRRLLEEGIAVRASDIDVALVAGGVVPGIEGGPMFRTGGEGRA